MGLWLLSHFRQYLCPKFIIFCSFLWTTVIMQRAMDGFYLEEMPTRVTRYIYYQMIADTQA